jgi:hypothetical protein
VAADLEIDALASQIEQIAQRAEARRIRTEHELRHAAARFDVIAQYRRLFIGDDGELTAPARAVIADFTEVAQLGRFDPGQISDAEMRERNGMRRLALHILSSIDQDGSVLRKLASKMREKSGE